MTKHEKEKIHTPLEQPWRNVGRYIRQAMEEETTSRGGAELWGHIEQTYLFDEAFPPPRALIALEQMYPGIAEKIIRKAEIIQEEQHKREKNTSFFKRVKQFFK